MYYVNQEQIAVRLDAIPELAEAMNALASDWRGDLLQGLAQERALHLAIETVTDVGSYLIDGFIMRDASSYEDIIEIVGGEGVYSAELQNVLTELVKLRKPLVQDYYDWPRSELHPFTVELPAKLTAFRDSVERYLKQELSL
ncbi:DUF86 domain-containing protein [Paenibacillus paeoniae]|uniref:DUF86 domain-containing protein n=1 Tax=Paenibacillus paeoniae TaxID=2292705 RepID=A0A371PMU0_9BACL|nr:HepT-like ribonuclease domain-containing protein [Paenibacillus paeoniae]REK77520.1 DUF86 domain-containing protein [Paenibacillus paeoniae]